MIWSSFTGTLPTTRKYRFGFDHSEDASLPKDRLVNAYDQMQKAWLNNRAEYVEFVEHCVVKNMRGFQKFCFLRRDFRSYV